MLTRAWVGSLMTGTLARVSSFDHSGEAIVCPVELLNGGFRAAITKGRFSIRVNQRNGTLRNFTSPHSTLHRLELSAQSLDWRYHKIQDTGRASNAEKQPNWPRPRGLRSKWAGGCIARRSRNGSDMLPPSALPTVHFDRNKIPAISGTGH